jgi:uncharacterized coiled-coil DUF342 family protein
MEPIQDDPGAIPQTTLMIPRKDFDRLVAERDRWKQKWIEDTSALEEERDTFMRDRREYKALAGELEAERDRLREALERITGELGVPSEDYPAPVAEAVRIAREALTKITEEGRA